MNIDRSKHNKYTTNAVYGNLTTGGIATDETGNVSGTGLQYSGNIIYVSGGGGGGIDPSLMDLLINQNAYSYMNISNGVYTVNASAKQLKDYINLNITGDNETVETLVSKDNYLNKTYYDATGLKGGRYSVAYKKVLVPGESAGEPVEIPKWVITLQKESGLPIFANADFNGILILNNEVEVGVYSIDNPRVTVNSDAVTGLVSIIISNPEPIDFTELRIIKAGDYINESTYSNIAIIKDIVIQEYITITITQAGATKYWLIDDLGRLFTTYDTYTTKSLGAYDKIWTNYGYTVGNYVQGISGGAFYIVDDLLNTYLEVDKLKVRKKAYFETLEIINVNSVGGKLIISPAGAVTLNKVEDKGTYYRCYFLGVQDGVEVENRFKKDDLAFSLNFNIKKPGEYEQVANHYFWRKVNAVSIDPDANGNHWIDLDKIDCDTDSDIPHINDVVAQLGNKTDTDRLSAMIFSSVDAESPRIILCHGINTYSLSSKEYFDLGVNHLTNQAYMNVYGNSFVGARDGSTYVKYTLADGLQIKGSISASSTFGGKTFSEVFVTTENFDDSVKAVVGDELEYLQNLIDGNIESYFYDYSPTTTNYPANSWTTEADKQRHNGDTFTNIQKFVSDITTPDAGKSWRWVKNASNVWGWTPISDSDAVLALKKAGEALDTADGKRRVFTRKPETADVYDIGDLWVNATYIDTVGLEVYSNDLLRAKKAKVKGVAFNITDWELASKYTDDTLASDAKALAEAALLAATDAGLAANTAQTTINDYKDTIDDVFQDGIITASEKNRLNNLKDTVNTTLFDVLTTYNKVYNNTNLDGKVLKTRLKTAYDAFSAAANALTDAVTSILNKVTTLSYSITKGDIATVDNAYTNFNTKYTDYVGALGDANLEITTSISSTAYTNAVNKYAWLNGLFDPDLTTTIEGGVVTTGVLALGKTTSGTFKVNAGINGVSNASYIGSGPAIWFGGDMLDKDNYSAGNRPANVATSMFRFDGSGYLGYKPNSVAAKDQAPIWWDNTGNIHANPLSFFVGEETVGLLLASFLAVDNTGDGRVDYVILKAPFTFVLIGNGYIGYDSATNSIYVYVLDSSGNKQMCNFYASGEVTAYGAGTSDPPISVLYLDELKDVLFTNLVANLLMLYNGSKWVNIDPSTIATKINSLGDITDVTLTSIATNDIIKWNGTKWVNVPSSSIGGSSAWADITGKPTTIAGYGITDALSTSSGDSRYVLKAGDTMTGALSFNFGVQQPTISIENGEYIINVISPTGGWERGIIAKHNNSAAVLAKFGFYGTGTALNYAYVGDYYTGTSGVNRTWQRWSTLGSTIYPGSSAEGFVIDGANSAGVYMGYFLNGTRKSQVGWHNELGTFVQYTELSTRPTLILGRVNNPLSGIQFRYSGTYWNILHEGNYTNYPSLRLDSKYFTNASDINWTYQQWAAGGAVSDIPSMSYAALLQVGESLSRGWQMWNSRNEPTIKWRPANTAQTAWENARVLLDSANYSSYALPLSGGTINGPLTISGGRLMVLNSLQLNAAGTASVSVDGTYGAWLQEKPTSYINIKDSVLKLNNNQIFLHSGNYNSYSPTLTGGGASGSWNIKAYGLIYPSLLATDQAFYGDAYTFGSFCSNSGTMPSHSDGYIMGFKWSSGSYVTQLALDVDPTYSMAIRHRDSSGVWRDWKNIITEVNIGNYEARSAKYISNTGSGAAGTSQSIATGWVRIGQTTNTDAGGNVFTLYLNRNYSHSNNENYIFQICNVYSGNTTITQVAGYANQRVIDQIRVTGNANSGVMYIDIHINVSVINNNYYWRFVGDATAQSSWTINPTTGNTTTTFYTAQGFSTSNILKGNYLAFRNYNNYDDAGYVGRGSNGNNTIYLAAYNNGNITIGETSSTGITTIQGGCLNVLSKNSNYSEGIRIYGTAKDSTWANIQFGCDPAVLNGTHANQWILGRSSTNGFILDLNNSTGAGGFVVNTAGKFGIGITAPAYRLHVGGDIYATARITTAADIYSASWVRTTGKTGWFNETYGGGIYMDDANYVKVYASKSFNVTSGTYYAVHISGGCIYSNGKAGSSWLNGYGIVNAIIPNNGNQTPLWVCARTDGSLTAAGADRIFAMELYNTGTMLRFAFGNAERFDFNSNGIFNAAGGITTGGSVTCSSININSRLNINTSGYMTPLDTNTRSAGYYGVYDSTRIAHIWSIGPSYKIPDNGVNFGTLYGLAYKHTNNSTSGTMAGGHQVVWCQNGTPYVALGDGLWVRNSVSVGGSITASGEITAYSDIRLKSNISNLAYRGRLIPKVYTKCNKRSIGFIAQEVQVLYPELVIENNDDNHYLSLNYGSITAVLASQINIIDDEVTTLRKQVNSLLLEVVELRKELSLLS